MTKLSKTIQICPENSIYMTKSKEFLSNEEQQLIQLLTIGTPLPTACQKLQISTRTAKRWLAQPHVSAALNELRKDVSTHVREQIKKLSTKAIQALEDSLTSHAPMVKLTAAKIVIDRVAPEDMNVEQDNPLQGKNVLISQDAMQYLTSEELDQIEALVQMAEQRKEQAELDRQQLERKRA